MTATAPRLVTGTGPHVVATIAAAMARITLNRPEAYNAIDASMTEGLAAAIAAIDADPDVRVIVLNGAGKGFCAGGDLRFFASRGDELGASVDRLLGAGNRFVRALHDTEKLVLTSVHGAAAGAGLSLAAAGDFCIAAADAVFVPGYAKLGVSPDLGGTASLTRAVGVRRAMRLYLLEDRLSAVEAERWGIVSKVVEPAALEQATLDLANALAVVPPAAVEATRRLVRQAPTTPLDRQLDAELAAFQACIHTPATEAALRRFAIEAAHGSRKTTRSGDTA